jgi:hypothetical protein
MLPDYANKYPGHDNYRKPKSEYVQKIHDMADQQLMEETKNVIWLSGYANNNPRADYHWQVDICYDEWLLRDKSDWYQKAYDSVLKSVRGY